MIARFLRLVVLVLCVAACVPSHDVTPHSAPLTEIADLAARPSAYEGQVVLIRGAAIVEFEGVFICASPAVIDHGQPNQCLWLNSFEVAGKAIDLSPFHLKNVELVGRVNSGSRGHMGLFAASFEVLSGKVLGHHGIRGFRPPPPPRSSANNSFNPMPLRGTG